MTSQAQTIRHRHMYNRRHRKWISTALCLAGLALVMMIANHLLSSFEEATASGVQQAKAVKVAARRTEARLNG